MFNNEHGVFSFKKFFWFFYTLALFLVAIYASYQHLYNHVGIDWAGMAEFWGFTYMIFTGAYVGGKFINKTKGGKNESEK
jgi:hypothetical protein